MKVVKDELLDNRMKESGIFLIWAGRPIMIGLLALYTVYEYAARVL